MRSTFANLNNNQNNAFLLNMPVDRRTSALASQYMDMFDASKLDTSLLTKRTNQAFDNLYQDNIQKKVKTLMASNDFKPTGFPQNLLFQQNNLFNNLPFQSNPLMDQIQAELGRAQQIQTLNLLLGNMKQQQQQSPKIPQFPSTKLNNQNNIALNYNKNGLAAKNHKTPQNLCVKEEYVKHEETSQGSPSLKSDKPTMCDTKSDTHVTTDSLSEIDKNDLHSFLEDGPVLVEYTKAFPEWDLATIFSFLKSGKPKDSFEREKKFRMERKLRKMKKAQKEKEKLGLLKGKDTKDKKAANKKQQYL